MTTFDSALQPADPALHQSYTLPDDAYLAAAGSRADHLWWEIGDEELARLMCLFIAATVRDFLTHFEHDLPFDAVELELAYGDRGEVATATGAYWTAAGEQREFTRQEASDINDWAHKLRGDNRGGWEPLCRLVSRRPTRYRLDLVRAAAPIPGI
ncbi:hypothetical protein [Streptomyces globosus]|uniref:hypothetical protein n=1 Tax=Streptomyces globosus TaxID=68209 RepID=UPI00363F20D6